MKALNVISTALLMLNEYDLHKYIADGGFTQDKFEKDKELLIKSLNEALYSITEYYPLVECERHEPQNGKIEYKNFSKNVHKIVAVYSDDGLKVSAEICPVYIKTQIPLNVTYKYFVTVSNLNDELPYENTPITENTLAFGLISEFLVYKGRFNEALAYSDKFVEGLIKARSFLNRKKLRAREWF